MFIDLVQAIAILSIKRMDCNDREKQKATKLSDISVKTKQQQRKTKISIFKKNHFGITEVMQNGTKYCYIINKRSWMLMDFAHVLQ